MISNNEIAAILSETADLSELHNGNPFKIKSYHAAAYRIDKMTEPLAMLSSEELINMPGIGKGIAAKITEIAQTGTLAELQELLARTPPGVIELFQVKGIGPKKIAYLWHKLGIESMGELLYACKENRLAQAKGFGEKTQQNIIDSIEFILSNANKFHYYKIEIVANELLKYINTQLPNIDVSFCGELRRKCEVLDKIELVAATDAKTLFDQLQSLKLLGELILDNHQIKAKIQPNLPVVIYTCKPGEFAYTLWQRTGSLAHTQQLQADVNAKSEVEIYAANGMQFVPPEMRENTGEIERAKNNQIPELINPSDLKGILHNHTTYSDGKNTLREMAEYAKQQGYAYLGICDHSQSATYANGLTPERVLKQIAEIDALNRELAPFKIFKGIESDVLGDGSLDYDEELLSQFDFVVASIHSNLKMNQDKAMMRLLRAIENPYTTVLGHPTGRLLLMREGYPIDHKTIIDACAAHDVAIEINANPYRLDLDWRWIDYALQKNVMLSINPDAHETEGYHDMYYGVCVARKGGLTARHCLNAMTLNDIEQYFATQKSKRG